VHVDQVDWKMNKMMVFSVPPNGKYKCLEQRPNDLALALMVQQVQIG
jgi:hypothetical protein